MPGARLVISSRPPRAAASWPTLAGSAVAKTLFVDVVAVLTAHGIAAQDIPAKLEGMAFGPDVHVGGVRQHTLWVANDNDFVATVVDTHHPAGIDNPNQFFVFAVDPSRLPGLVRPPGHDH